jgi:mediator of RNA polymerase II transcription subunit 7
MAEEQPPPASISSAFPSPPPFYKLFTPENIERISSLRAAQSSSSNPTDCGTALPIRVFDLPPELRNLQPPEPPQDGVYRCFGELLRVGQTSYDNIELECNY